MRWNEQFKIKKTFAWLPVFLEDTKEWCFLEYVFVKIPQGNDYSERQYYSEMPTERTKT